MKTKIAIKKKSIGIALSLVLALTNASWANTFEDQVAVTVDSIEQLKQNFAGQITSDQIQLNVTDYRSWKVEFDRKIEAALIEFESDLENKVRLVLSETIRRYYSVYNNPNLSNTVKIRQLDAIYGQLMVISLSAEINYQNALKKLLNKTWIIPEKYILNFNEKKITPIYIDGTRGEAVNLNSEMEIIKKSNRLGRADNYYSIVFSDLPNANEIVSETDFDSNPVREILNDGSTVYSGVYGGIYHGKYAVPWQGHGIFKSYALTHQKILQGCISLACIGMKAAEYVAINSLLRDSFNKSLVIQLPYLISDNTSSSDDLIETNKRIQINGIQWGYLKAREVIDYRFYEPNTSWQGSSNNEFKYYSYHIGKQTEYYDLYALIMSNNNYMQEFSHLPYDTSNEEVIF